MTVTGQQATTHTLVHNNSTGHQHVKHLHACMQTYVNVPCDHTVVLVQETMPVWYTFMLYRRTKQRVLSQYSAGAALRSDQTVQCRYNLAHAPLIFGSDKEPTTWLYPLVPLHAKVHDTRHLVPVMACQEGTDAAA